MDASISSLNGPVARGLFEAREAVSDTVEGCRKKGRRVISQIREGVEGYSQEFKKQHPVATCNLKTMRDYAVKTARAAGNGVKAAATGIASIYDRVIKQCQSAKRFVETQCPKAAIAMKALSEFALNPITYALKGAGLGVVVSLMGELAFSFTAMLPFVDPIVMGGAAAGAGFGLAKAALNSARYTLKLEGAEQHPYLAKAVSLCDRVLSPIKKADRFMEELHPALSIPYKALKELSVAAITIPACLIGGELGIEAVDEVFGSDPGPYRAIGLSDTTCGVLAGTAIAGTVMFGVVKPVWNVGRFAYDRLGEYRQPKGESQPVLHVDTEVDYASMV